jgi:hypothetical protein
MADPVQRAALVEFLEQLRATIPYMGIVHAVPSDSHEKDLLRKLDGLLAVLVKSDG